MKDTPEARRRLALKMAKMFAPKVLTGWEKQHEQERKTKTGFFSAESMSAREKSDAEHKERVRAYHAMSDKEKEAYQRKIRN